MQTWSQAVWQPSFIKLLHQQHETNYYNTNAEKESLKSMKLCNFVLIRLVPARLYFRIFFLYLHLFGRGRSHGKRMFGYFSQMGSPIFVSGAFHTRLSSGKINGIARNPSSYLFSD